MFGSFGEKPSHFGLILFLDVLMRNNNKMSENDVGKVWVQNLFILGWFQLRQVFNPKVVNF